MKLKIEERLRAITLREQGRSVNEIVSEIGVAKSSVSTWVRNVPLSQAARIRLLEKITKGQLVSAQRKHQRTLDRIEHHRLAARADIAKISIDRSLQRLLCALLYWCEGAKNHYAGVYFVNSDPALVRSFLSLFREGYNPSEIKFRARIHLHEYHDAKRQLRFWARVTGVPRKQFGMPYLKPHTGKRIRKNYPGCIAIRYHSNDMARQLIATAQAFLEKSGGVGQW